MATEVLQYIDDNRMISQLEVKALYVGILMDTKNFMIKPVYVPLRLRRI